MLRLSARRLSAVCHGSCMGADGVFFFVHLLCVMCFVCFSLGPLSHHTCCCCCCDHSVCVWWEYFVIIRQLLFVRCCDVADSRFHAEPCLCVSLIGQMTPPTASQPCPRHPSLKSPFRKKKMTTARRNGVRAKPGFQSLFSFIFI